MRKALLERFILVLLAALCINSVIFYIASSKMMLKNSKNDMTYTIKAVDSILDYDRDLMEQMERLEAFTDQDSSRVTLIKSDGTVVTDSDADAEYLDNHQGREEIRAAMEQGEGYARRYSKTLGKPCSMWPAALSIQTWCSAWPCPIPAYRNTFPCCFRPPF